MDTMRERFTRVASRLLDGNERLALVLAEIGADGFADAARRHPGRVINVGIREQLLIGTGGGLALTGMRPLMHTFASFLVERPFEQLKLDFGHQGTSGVLVSAAASHDWPAGGYTHMSPGDVALLDTLDGWTVHVPGHPDEAEALLERAAAADGERVHVRLSEQSNAVARPVGGGLHPVRTGSPTAAVVLAVGPVLDAVLDATAGLDVTVLYVATARPLDTRALRVAAGDRPRVVLVEPLLAGTSAAVVSQALADVPHRLLSLGVGRRELRRYGEVAEHLAAHGLDPASLRHRIGGFLR